MSWHGIFKRFHVQKIKNPFSNKILQCHENSTVHSRIGTGHFTAGPLRTLSEDIAKHLLGLTGSYTL